MTALVIDRVTVRYGGVVAVDDVSLTLEQGLITGIVGPNGAGKTSLLGVMSGFIRPVTGTLSIDTSVIRLGQPHVLARAGVRRSFQNARPLRTLTVADNVGLGAHGSSGTHLLDDLLRTRRARRGEVARRASAAEALSAVGLEDVSDAPVTTLSYGQLRLMEIARALVSQPWMLLLDEPAAGLNDAEAGRLGDLLMGLARERNIGVVLVEHNLGLIMDVCDSLHVLNMGRSIASGPPDEVAHEPAVVTAYTGLRS